MVEHTCTATEEPWVINCFTINSFFDDALVFNFSASTFSSSKYIPLSSNSKHFKFNGSQSKDILVSPGLKHGVGAVLYLQQVVKVKVTQLCLSLCDPMDYTVHGVLQARITEWVPVPFSRGSSQPQDGTQVSTLQADSLPAEPQGRPIASSERGIQAEAMGRVNKEAMG